MELFGFELKRKDKEATDKLVSPIAPVPDDGSAVINAAGNYGIALDIEGSVRDDSELIKRYREVATYPDTNSAIEDIVNEAVAALDDEESVTINLDEIKDISEGTKKKIEEEFDEVKSLLDFESKGHDIFKRWYIDGRIFYQKMVNPEAPKDGILELRYIDPRKIRKVKEVKKELENGVEIIKNVTEYYIYLNSYLTANNTVGVNTSMAFNSKGVKLPIDSVVYATSGLIDLDKNVVLSYLNEAIKPVNSLRMMEDAMVIYRMSRAPERRIFYIDTGKMAPAKAQEYVKKVMNQYKNKVVYDACLAMDTLIPLLDGRTLPLYEIQKEFEAGKELWVYSCDPVTGKFAPGLVSSAGVTAYDQQVMRITLDNGKTITCTYDHKFPTWNKGKVEAKDLEVGDSMIPRYIRQKAVVPGHSEYEQVFNNDTQKWEFTHRLVSKWKDELELDNEWTFNPEFSDFDKKTVHHLNVDRFDNRPSNLVRMHNEDHKSYHQKYAGLAGSKGGKSTFINKKGMYSLEGEAARVKAFKEYMTNPVTNLEFRKKQKENWTEENKLGAKERAISSKLSARGNAAKSELYKTEEYQQEHKKKYATVYTQEMIDFVESFDAARNKLEDCIKGLSNSVNLSAWKAINSSKVGTQKNWNVIVKEDIVRILKSIGFGNWTEFKNFRLEEAQQFRNHKITKIEYLEERMDVGTLGIDKDEIYHDHHTFALDVGIYTCNSTGEIRDDRRYLNLLEDFWMPRPEGSTGTQIDTLPGGQNLGDIADVEYFQKKLLQSLHVPLSRLNPDQSQVLFGSSNVVSRDELKFTKFISRLRKRFSTLFLDLLRTQLSLKGIMSTEQFDAVSNKILFDFNQDEYFAEMKESEILKNRFQTLELVEPYIGTLISKDFALKKILRLSDEDIKEMEDQNKAEPYLPQQAMIQLQMQSNQSTEPAPLDSKAKQ